MIIFFFGLPSDEPWLIGSAVMAGFFLISLLPVTFECAVEVTFPVNEATSAGLLVMAGNAYAVLFIVAYTVYSDNAISVTAVIIIIFAATLQQLFSFRPQYKRLAMEKSRNKETTLE